MVNAALRDIQELAPFRFRWPDTVEAFEGGWTYTAFIDGRRHSVRHGIGSRDVYGRLRVHTVTWLDGDVQVEGVEADDYPTSQALVSRLRRAGRAMARTWSDIPAGYVGFDIVEHRREVDAPYSPACLAVKLRENDLAAWALHAHLRGQLPRSGAHVAEPVSLARPPVLPPPPSPNSRAVADALLAHAEALAAELAGKDVAFTDSPSANALIHKDPFAFLLAVIADMGIKAERAWALPYELSQRLGGLSPKRLTDDPAGVDAAFQHGPKLHRFVKLMPHWYVEAAEIVLERYGGHAERLWADEPTAVELRQRLEAFPGIGQKKAAMAVEILARDLHKPLRQLSGSDVAYDVHLRRVFLRTGLVDRDDVARMVAVAQALHPDRPGALDLPAWDVGRRWCRPVKPDCPTCPLNAACPRLIERGALVRGV